MFWCLLKITIVVLPGHQACGSGRLSSSCGVAAAAAPPGVSCWVVQQPMTLAMARCQCQESLGLS